MRKNTTQALKTLLALGDSYTVGESLATSLSWPEQYARMQNASGLLIVQPVSIIAKTSWTTDELMHAISAAQPLQQYDYVSLLIGVNNQYRGRSLENFRIEFKQLAETAIQLCKYENLGVQVLSIPDWGQTPFGMASGRESKQISIEIDAFNQVASSVCEGMSIAFLDITTLTRKHSDQAHMHAEDGLHPSRQMYHLWANALLSQGKFGKLNQFSREE
jgi:lysophospholipase L1-like esterase